MGRHVNHFDVQDKLISTNRRHAKGEVSTEPTLAEQIALDNERKSHNKKVIANRVEPPAPPTRYSGKS